MGLKHHPRVVTDGLIYYLDAANSRCYSGSGNTTYSLVNGIGGTLYNGIGFTSSYNGIFTFDGTNDYIEFDYNSAINNISQFTIECWYKSSNINVEGILFNTNTYLFTTPVYGYHLEIYQSKLLFQVFPSESAVQSTITLQNNNWYNLIATYNSGNINLYVNSSIGGTGSAIFNPSTGSLLLGKYRSGHFVLNGQLGIIKFYNRALSATEILQNYNATKGRYGI